VPCVSVERLLVGGKELASDRRVEDDWRLESALAVLRIGHHLSLRIESPLGRDHKHNAVS